MPLYQNPDEVAHFMRAEAISEDGVIGARFPTIGGGGIIDLGIERSAAIFEPLKFDSKRKVTLAMAEEALAVKWGTEAGPRGFANTAIYSPVSYIPAVVGIWIGKGIHLPVIRTLVISRLLMGLTGIAIATVALAGCGAPFLFVILNPADVAGANDLALAGRDDRGAGRARSGPVNFSVPEVAVDFGSVHCAVCGARNHCDSTTALCRDRRSAAVDPRSQARWPNQRRRLCAGHSHFVVDRGRKADWDRDPARSGSDGTGASAAHASGEDSATGYRHVQILW
jgi:hypothetical protein